MLLPGRYKGARRRLRWRPRSLEEIMEWNFKLPKGSLDFGERKNRMPRSDFFQGGNWLKAADFKNGQIVIIDEFSAAKTRIGTRPLLRLRGFDSPFGLNATNYDTLVEKFGEDEKKWTGKRVKIVLTTAPNPSNGGKVGPAVRLA